MADQVIQDIRDRLDVVDVVSSYISLKRAGTNFKTNCPFHSEKSGSFIVSPQKQIWHCFGCGEGGDIFGFVMKYEGVDFKEALKLLAGKAGVVLPEYKGRSAEEEGELKMLLRINAFAARYYHEVLMKSPVAEAARAYVALRGLTKETLELWQIGYAPDEFHALEKVLSEKKVNQFMLITAGVSVKNEKGQVYDRFRDRVTFPIFNYYGEAVGFSARILKKDDQSAKYINSPETAIYHKSKILFGLNFAKQEIRKRDAVVIVEGQMDCIKAHQAGFQNTVATSGTALTEDHLSIVGRLTKNLFFCFDGDKAGLTAARRAGELALSAGFKIKMVVLEGAKDPDELISRDPALWEKALAGSRWFVDVYIDYGTKHFEYNSIEQKHYVQEELVPLLKKLIDPFDRQHYIERISRTFGLPEKLLGVSGMPQAPKEVRAHEQTAAPADTKLALLEKQILGGVLMNPDFARLVLAEGHAEDFGNEEIRGVLLPFFETGIMPNADASPVMREAVFMMESVLEAHNGNQLGFLKTLEKSFFALRLAAIRAAQEKVMSELKQAELRGNKEEVGRLQELFADFSRQRMGLDSRG